MNDSSVSSCKRGYLGRVVLFVYCVTRVFRSDDLYDCQRPFSAPSKPKSLTLTLLQAPSDIFWPFLTQDDTIGLISSHFCEEMLSALPMLLLLRVLPRWMENSGESSLFARPMGQVTSDTDLVFCDILWHLVTFAKVANDSDIFCSTSWLAHRSCSSWTCP